MVLVAGIYLLVHTPYQTLNQSPRQREAKRLPIANRSNTHEVILYASGLLLKLADRVYVPGDDPDGYPYGGDVSWQPLLHLTSDMTRCPGLNPLFDFQRADTTAYDILFIVDDCDGEEVYSYKAGSSAKQIAVFGVLKVNAVKIGKGRPPIPRLREINRPYHGNGGVFGTTSADGRYVTFDMYNCWYCDTGYPQTLLYDIDTKTAKWLGQTSYFQWKDNGKYEYTDFVPQRCTALSLDDTYERVPYAPQDMCPADPRSLPLKTGDFATTADDSLGRNSH